MYEVPHNTRPISKWPIMLISLYYMVLGSLAAINSISFFITMIYSDMLDSHRIMSTLWLALIVIANAGRLAFFVGLINYRRWAYCGSLIIETLMIMHAGYTLAFSKIRIYEWIIISIGMIGIVILGYLFRPKVWRTFFGVEE
ncbi:hypothetical protein [Herpetosiphon geysericola]|uniref:Uncharacterized protein n=1 Tax=Herpetosiphon geysericola TaxID=70996 RepID=A0A0N8GPK9_9CHLR|nr:hypothetical protein [Herpetosiphon geysericola]KPL81186.1 hypothetical protein SE18_21045 [Herpetosiphon geysericola]